MDNVLKIST